MIVDSYFLQRQHGLILPVFFVRNGDRPHHLPAVKQPRKPVGSVKPMPASGNLVLIALRNAKDQSALVRNTVADRSHPFQVSVDVLRVAIPTKPEMFNS